MLPLRAVGMLAGINDISWNSQTRTATLVRDGHTITVIPAANRVLFDGKAMAADAGIVVKDGRIFVSVRNIVEAFDMQVQWNEATKSVSFIRKIKGSFAANMHSVKEKEPDEGKPLAGSFSF